MCISSGATAVKWRVPRHLGHNTATTQEGAQDRHKVILQHHRQCVTDAPRRTSLGHDRSTTHTRGPGFRLGRGGRPHTHTHTHTRLGAVSLRSVANHDAHVVRSRNPIPEALLPLQGELQLSIALSGCCWYLGGWGQCALCPNQGSFFLGGGRPFPPTTKI